MESVGGFRVRAREFEDSIILYITQHPLVFCTELDSLRGITSSQSTVTARYHLRLLSYRECKGDVRYATRGSVVQCFLKLFQNDSFFMPNLSTDFSIKLERRRERTQERGEREENVSRYSRAIQARATRIRLN